MGKRFDLREHSPSLFCERHKVPFLCGHEVYKQSGGGSARSRDCNGNEHLDPPERC